jgi:hypothetical protein
VINISIYDFIDLLPHPGEYGGVHIVDTIINGKKVKNMVGIIIQDRDTAWKYTPSNPVPVPVKDSDIFITPTSYTQFFKASSKGNLGYTLILNDDYKHKPSIVGLELQLKRKLETGRVLRIAKSETYINCFSPNTFKRQAFNLCYSFSDSAFVKLDPVRSMIFWGGFTAQLKW